MLFPKIITALCTPLTEQETLHQEGLEAHIQDQLHHGIDGLLVGGTMGAMQLLCEATFQDLVTDSIRFNKDSSELLIGVGETSFARTLEKIRRVEHLAIDGLVVITPYFIRFNQDDLLQYFQTLADVSVKPLFLYDLPQLTGTKLSLETVQKLSTHPNIRGIKCSDQLSLTRPVLELADDSFRVIVAQPLLTDMLIRSGVGELLDGVYGFAPHWVREMAEASKDQDWDRLAKIQRDFAELLQYLLSFPISIFSTVTALLNLRGIPGNMAPRPMRPFTEKEREQFAEAPIVRRSLENRSTSLVET